MDTSRFTQFLKQTNCAAFLVFSLTGPTFAAESITIEALIDGRSQLLLQSNTAQWFHIDFAAPGRFEGVFEPTVINGVNWFPVWPDQPDSNDPDSENRDCHCFSDVFEDVVPGIPKQESNFDLEPIQVRGSANIVQFPTFQNDYTLIIEFDDNPIGAADDYVVKLTVSEKFGINAGLNDAWYNSATTGQGFLITVFPDIKQLFLAWFTFDTERPPEDVAALLGEPGHRWLTAQGSYDGDTASLTIFVTKGGVFDAAEPAASTDPAGDGTMTLEFADCTEGLVTYEITSLGISGEIPIQRIALDNIPLCESLNEQLQQVR